MITDDNIKIIILNHKYLINYKSKLLDVKYKHIHKLKIKEIQIYIDADYDKILKQIKYILANNEIVNCILIFNDCEAFQVFINNSASYFCKKKYNDLKIVINYNINSVHDAVYKASFQNIRNLTLYVNNFNISILKLFKNLKLNEINIYYNKLLETSCNYHNNHNINVNKIRMYLMLINNTFSKYDIVSIALDFINHNIKFNKLIIKFNTTKVIINIYKDIYICKLKQYNINIDHPNFINEKDTKSSIIGNILSINIKNLQEYCNNIVQQYDFNILLKTGKNFKIVKKYIHVNFDTIKETNFEYKFNKDNINYYITVVIGNMCKNSLFFTLINKLIIKVKY